MIDNANRGERGHRDVSPADKHPRTISSRELLGGDKLVIIRHDHEDYRLQLTATGKLILTK